MSRQLRETVTIEHPSGPIEVVLEVRGHGAAMDVRRAGIVRTCRRLFEGNMLTPASVWRGH